MKADDDEEGLLALERNMPAWGNKYEHPTEAVRKIDVPVVNIGTVGYDGHKVTERVDMTILSRCPGDGSWNGKKTFGIEQLELDTHYES